MIKWAISRKFRRRRGTPLRNLTLMLASLLLSVALIEIASRVVLGLPVVAWADWRTEQVVFSRYGERTVRDPVLGWTNLPWTDADGFQTIDHGIRANFAETVVRTGAVLAVGDSFTEGWEVGDSETWPAVLEGMTAVPVVNAGIGAYGTDQIVLRAEALIPIVKPKVLIVDFLEDDVARSLYTLYGTPKPYFTIENGELAYHPPGPLEPHPPGSWASLRFALRNALGYFAAADYVLSRLAPDYWYSTQSEPYALRDDVDDVAITCALLARLKAQTDQGGIRMAVLMQYTAQGILLTGARTREAEGVIACARGMGLRVIDQFPSLHEIALNAPPAMQEYYQHDYGNYGHMSAQGNRLTAQLVSTALQDWIADLSLAAATGQPPAQLPIRRVTRARVGDRRSQ